jgi:DNA-binding transcriptional LysR family regulator
VREGFDCVLRVAALTDSSLIAKPLGHYRMINYASPAYLATYGTPETLDDLACHRLIHYLPTFGGHSAGFEYCDPNHNNDICYLPMPGSLTVNNSDTYLSACLAGLGIIQSPEASLKTYINSGQLLEILPQYRAAPMPVSLVYANRRHLPMRVQVFMTWIAEIMKPRLMV